MTAYPDDIHQYDDDPRSPFYDGGDEEEPVCEGCDQLYSNCECDQGEDEEGE